MTDLLTQKKRSETGVVVGAVLSAVGFVGFLPAGMGSPVLVLPMIGLFLGGAILAGSSASRFKKAFREWKTDGIRKVLPHFGSDARFLADHGFTAEQVYSSLLLRRADRFFSEDMLSGSLGDLRFLSADVKLQDVRHTGKTTTVVTTFLGRVYLLDFSRDFPTDLTVFQPSFGRAWGFGDYGYQTVTLESVDFNRELLVLAKDPLAAFRILTPPVMERLMALDRRYDDRIALSIQGSRLWIAVRTGRDHFEAKLFQPLPETMAPDLEEDWLTVREWAEALEMRHPSGMKEEKR
ncbi:MAG TPA: DUF3137 domain-containing protein [Bacillota bacterium]|nr:DUF3137 domain-containing protein [Bacillota bacterium]